MRNKKEKEEEKKYGKEQLAYRTGVEGLVGNWTPHVVQARKLSNRHVFSIVQMFFYYYYVYQSEK